MVARLCSRYADCKCVFPCLCDARQWYRYIAQRDILPNGKSAHVEVAFRQNIVATVYFPMGLGVTQLLVGKLREAYLCIEGLVGSVSELAELCQWHNGRTELTELRSGDISLIIKEDKAEP